MFISVRGQQGSNFLVAGSGKADHNSISVHSIDRHMCDNTDVSTLRNVGRFWIVRESTFLIRISKQADAGPWLVFLFLAPGATNLSAPRTEIVNFKKLQLFIKFSRFLNNNLKIDGHRNFF